MGSNVRASSISSYLSQAMYAHLTPDGELRDHTYPIDNTRAAAMYEKAACLGVAAASAAVCRAEMHVHALGGARNFVQAVYWYSQAVVLGMGCARKELRQLLQCVKATERKAIARELADLLPEQGHTSSDDAEVDVAADEMGASRSPRSAGI